MFVFLQMKTFYYFYGDSHITFCVVFGILRLDDDDEGPLMLLLVLV